jgi:hypothetical protein
LSSAASREYIRICEASVSNLGHAYELKDKYLMRFVALNCRNENMLEPTHATSDGKLIFYKWIIKHLPAPTVNAVMCKTPLTRYGNIATIIGI